jgi:hypothetical protein
MSEMSTTWATKYDGAVSDDLKYWFELILNYFMEQASHLGLFSLWAKSPEKCRTIEVSSLHE